MRRPIRKVSRKHAIRFGPLDILFSTFIRCRAGWKCEVCGRSFPIGAFGLHCSHFIGRRNKATRWDRDNAMAACYGDHTQLDTHKATLFRDIMQKRLGDRFDELVARSRAVRKWTAEDVQALKVGLRGEIEQMGYVLDGRGRTSGRAKVDIAKETIYPGALPGVPVDVLDTVETRDGKGPTIPR